MVSRGMDKIKNSGQLVYAFLFAFMLFITVAAFKIQAATIAVEIVMLSLIPVATLSAVKSKEMMRSWLVIMIPFFLTWCLGFRTFSYQNLSERLVAVFGLLCFFLMTAVIAYNRALSVFEHKNLAHKKTLNEGEGSAALLLKRYWLIGLFIIIYFGLTLSDISRAAFFDSSDYYYKSISNMSDIFSFTLKAPKLLRMCTHLSMGYALTLLPGELIVPHSGEAVYVINLILAALSAISLYRLTDFLFPEKSLVTKQMVSGIYLFSPFILGTIGFINIDIPCVFFFVIMLSNHIRKNTFLELVAAYMFVFTKETSLIFYIAMLVVMFILDRKPADIIKRFVIPVSWGIIFVSNKMKIPNVMFAVTLVMLVTGILLTQKRIRQLIVKYWLAIVGIVLGATALGLDALYKTGMLLVIKEKLFTWKGSEMSSFSINKQNIANKFLQVFCLNFNWVFTIVIVIAAAVIIYMIFKKKIKLTKDYVRFLALLASVLITELAFFMVYYDFQHPRYMALASVIVMLLAVTSLFVINIKAATPVASVIFILLLLTQSFINIDFVSNRVFPVEQAYGSNIICSMWECMGDQSVYNREYRYYIKAIEKAMAEADFDGKTVLEFGSADNIFYLSTECYYDTKKKCFVSVKNEDTVKIHLSETKNSERILRIDKLKESDEENPVVKYGTVSIRYRVSDI